jgi:hypothetical protein
MPAPDSAPDRFVKTTLMIERSHDEVPRDLVEYFLEREQMYACVVDATPEDSRENMEEIKELIPPSSLVKQFRA